MSHQQHATRSPVRVIALLVSCLVLATSACTTELSSQHAATKGSTTTRASGASSTDAASDSSDTSGSSDTGDTGSASSSDSRGSSGPSTTERRSPTTNPKGTADQGTLVVADECRPGPGKTVTQEPDVVIEAKHEATTKEPTSKINGHKVPGFAVGGYDLPEQVVDGGCIIEHDAPGGCLGAVEITAVTVPDQSIPGFTLPGLEVGGKRVEGETVKGDSVRGDTVPGSSTPQVCLQAPSKDSRYIASVYRPSVSRASASRASLSRPSASRPSLSLDDGTFVGAAFVPGAFVPGVFVSGVFVEGKSIDGVELPDTTTDVFSNDTQSSYFAPADVLFDFNKSDIKPDAAVTLHAIVDDIKQNFPTGTIRVDGHTDSIGDDATNQTLSEQRAEAVKQWLVTEGGISADRITTKGYGETVSVEPNTKPDGSDNPDGRAKNRRVVITATH